LFFGDGVSLEITIDLSVVNRLFIHPELALLVFEGTLRFGPSELHRGVSLQILDVETPFCEPTLELFLTEYKVTIGFHIGMF
jgi:hypothetical protein